MRILDALVLSVIVSGCQHQAPSVHCDRHLVPINTPVPPAAGSAPGSVATP